jgi:DNA polymerase III epsilon subunit family exonuclease
MNIGDKNMNFDWAFLDLETTGLDYRYDKVIEIAIIVVRKDGTRDTYETLINPGVSISPFITNLTGIDDAMVEDAPTANDVSEKIRHMIEGKIIVAHNASFDIRFLENLLDEPLPNKSVDTLELAKILFPRISSYSLRYLVRNFLLDVQPTHRALADTLALEKLHFYLLKETNSLSLQEVQGLSYCFQNEDRGLPALIENILNDKIRTFNFNQPAVEKPVNAESLPESYLQGVFENINAGGTNEELCEWSPEELVEMFMPGGAIAKGLKTYQKRPE